MKNKNITYGLIAATLVLWGIIFYRIFSSLEKDEKPDQAADIHFSNNSFAETTDTFKLSDFQRDPFLGNIMNANKVNKHLKRLPKQNDSIDWTSIKYFGVMYNKAAKKKITFMNIRDKDRMMAEGQKIDNVTLVKNYGDSVKVSYAGKVKYIKRP